MDIRVVALAPYPPLAASTRYRLSQLQGPLAELGISMEVRAFLDDEGMRHLYERDFRRRAAAIGRGIVRRAHDVLDVRQFDVVVVQREAMLVGPPIVEWLVSRLEAVPLVLDIDDPIWLPESSLVPSSLSWIRNWPGKANQLFHDAKVVTCGNSALVDYVSSRGSPAVLVPTAVDLDHFRPSPRLPAPVPIVGWVGSHSTYPYLEAILPFLEELGRSVPFRLRVVGSGRTTIALGGVPVDTVAFDLEREADDFSGLDVGLYPLAADVWAAGKSGLKAMQYMASGVPYVASPIGVVADIGVPGVTHLLAESGADWQTAVGSLLTGPELRKQMGAAGRRHAVAHHGVRPSAEAFAGALRAALGGRR